MVRIATLDDDGLLTSGQVPALATLGATATGEALIEAASAAAARTALELGGAATLAVGTTTGTVAAGDDSRIAGALPAANLDTAATALDANAASALRVQQDARLSSTYVPRAQVGGLAPNPLLAVTDSLNSGTPRILDVFGGYTWGFTVNGDIYRQPLAGGAWALYTANTPGDVASIMRLIPTDDGEVLLASTGKVYKSSGWDTPESVTWSQKVEANSPTAILRWSFDGDGTKFIAASYAAGDDFAASRYAYISTDAGESFALSYDSDAMHGTVAADASHIHGVAYDPWGDRFYISEGHGTIGGIYCSDDDGATWTRPAAMASNPSPTTITPTPDGLVCGSDNSNNGLYGVVRADDPAEQELVQTWSWETGLDGLVGHARTAYYDDHTGLVFVGYTIERSGVSAIISAGTPTSGDLVYTWTGSVGLDRFDNVLAPTPNRVLALGVRSDSTVHDLEATAPAPGAPRDLDPGNIKGGVVGAGTSLAVGPTASAGTTVRAVAVGVAASNNSGGQSSTAVGYSADTSGSYSTAVGDSATAGPNATAVGYNANGSTHGGAILVGYNTVAQGPGALAIGQGASARPDSIAIGTNATHTPGSTLGVSIGHAATARSYSVAIGYQSVNSADWQVTFGARHFEMEEVATAPAAAAANKARMYLADDGAGKTQLCVKFSDGAVHVLAVQA